MLGWNRVRNLQVTSGRGGASHVDYAPLALWSMMAVEVGWQEEHRLLAMERDRRNKVVLG